MALPSGQLRLQNTGTEGWGQSDGKWILWMYLVGVFPKKAMFSQIWGKYWWRLQRMSRSPLPASNKPLYHAYVMHVCMCACWVTQLCPNLCNPMDCSPPGSSIHGIFLARILEWVAVSYSRGSSQPRDQTHVSCISIIGRLILYHCAPWGAVTDQNNRWIIDMDVMEMLGREHVCFWQFSPKEWAICLVLLLRINLKP